MKILLVLKFWCFYLPLLEYEGSIGLVTRKVFFSDYIFFYFLWINNMIWAIIFFPSVTRCGLSKNWSRLAQLILAPVVFWVNLMSLILRIFKFGILRVPPIQIPTKRSTHSSKIWLCVARKSWKTKHLWVSIDLQCVTSLHAPYLCIIFFCLESPTLQRPAYKINTDGWIRDQASAINWRCPILVLSDWGVFLLSQILFLWHETNDRIRWTCQKCITVSN
jgi:hypothetical protein